MVTEFPIELNSVLTLVDDAFYAQNLEAEIVESGEYLLEIEASGVHDKDALFRQVASAVGMPRSADSVDKWSALEDDLWSAICGGGTASGAIVVRDADHLLDGAVAEFLELVDILRTLARLAPSPEGALDVPMNLFIILTGTGPSFSKHL
jgi:hypothetical protein